VSRWAELDLTTKVLDVLTALDSKGTEHHFGRPYVTAYQLAIEFQRRHPDTVAALAKPLGGVGTGQETSLAQYLANELSKQIKAQGASHPVEGAHLSDQHIKSLTLNGPDRSQVTSSLTGTGFPLSMFRLRPPDPEGG
jgi:hypothetical protein